MKRGRSHLQIFSVGSEFPLETVQNQLAGRQLVFTACEGQRSGRKKNRLKAVSLLPHAELSGLWISNDS